MHDCVYCDQPGRFKIVNGHISERGTIWVCANHCDGLHGRDISKELVIATEAVKKHLAAEGWVEGERQY